MTDDSDPDPNPDEQKRRYDEIIKSADVDDGAHAHVCAFVPYQQRLLVDQDTGEMFAFTQTVICPFCEEERELPTPDIEESSDTEERRE